MGWKDLIEPVVTRIPAVQRPDGHVSLTDKLKWTLGIVAVYFTLTNIPIFGMGGEASDMFGSARTILAGANGSLMQVGIMPIVTASITLQLLSGANLLGLDTNDPRDQAIYQGLQKLLVGVMVVLTGLPMAFGGFLPPSQRLAAALGVPLLAVNLFIFFQIAVGGLLVFYFDEVVSKWGVGSGIGLFIIAGVSQKLIGGLIAWDFNGSGLPTGIIPRWIGIITGSIDTGGAFTSNWFNTLLLGPGSLVAIFTTVLIFTVVVYAESVRVEIPLSHAKVKGARGKFPVKLIYASVLPMILVRALQANLQFIGRILHNTLGDSLPAIIGVYNSAGQPVAGLMYYLKPIYRPQDWMWFLGGTAAEPWMIAIRVAIDLTFMVVGGAIFAIFWVETTEMGPEATAKQIQNSGMQIPGFRRNPKVVERVMERYIPQVTVIGGALVGLLAVMANMLGTIGQVSGTGLLLTVSITYKLYEEIAEERLMEMHPMMREFFGG